MTHGPLLPCGINTPIATSVGPHRFSITMFSSLLFLLSVPALLVNAASAPGDRFLYLRPNNDTALCLNVRGGVFADGTHIMKSADCNYNGGLN